MTNPSAAMIVIGDEILSGRTRDTNTNYIATALTAHGINLQEARVISDDRDKIINTVRELSKTYDHVMTSGGIGPTHDDITAEAVAEAMGADIDIRDDARAILQEFYDGRGQDLNEARLRMARIPEGAELIDNPISAAPGFSLGNVHVMAGVPSVFEAMVTGLIPKLTGGAPLLSRNVTLICGEGDIADSLGHIAAAHPDITIGSYPFYKEGRHGINIILRGHNADILEQAAQKVAALP